MKYKKQISEVSQTQNLESIEDLRIAMREDIEKTVRSNALEWASQLIQEEVRFLCGNTFSRKSKKNLAYRGGSETGSIFVFGKKEKINRPRVRKEGQEILLESYSALHEGKDFGEIVFKLMVSGLTTRSFVECLQSVSEEVGVSKSKISREFIKKSREHLNEINTRRFKGIKFWAIIVDGIHISDEVLVVILGIDTEGNKHFLGISQGSTENFEIVSGCLRSLFERQIQFTDKIIAVIDGAKALRKGLIEFFGERVSIQRCIIHKMRNVDACLPDKHKEEFRERFQMCYGLNEFESAKSEFQKLLDWVGSISENAANSLQEGKDEILSLHRIKVPSALRKSLSTTNCIDSAFSHPRSQMNRVKRWRKKNDMIRRWAGALFYRQELHFRKIKNYRLIEGFLKVYSPLDEKVFDKNEKEVINKLSAA